MRWFALLCIVFGLLCFALVFLPHALRSSNDAPRIALVVCRASLSWRLPRDHNPIQRHASGGTTESPNGVWHHLRRRSTRLTLTGRWDTHYIFEKTQNFPLFKKCRENLGSVRTASELLAATTCEKFMLERLAAAMCFLLCVLCVLFFVFCCVCLCFVCLLVCAFVFVFLFVFALPFVFISPAPPRASPTNPSLCPRSNPSRPTNPMKQGIEAQLEARAKNFS